ncbi:hypothetical protein ACN3XK_72805 [Actinomadura welshii]
MYALFRRWQRAGVWARVVAGLQRRADAAGLICWEWAWIPRSPGPTGTPPVPAPGRTGRPNSWMRVAVSRPIAHWDDRVAG